ncbi:hypothetical protein EDD85DRAFT_956168 [Armillaria nabsnona]|nr:hypothetical protein EDD85DRAFT_956168 [Armillaria nabsnona]
MAMPTMGSVSSASPSSSSSVSLAASIPPPSPPAFQASPFHATVIPCSATAPSAIPISSRLKKLTTIERQYCTNLDTVIQSLRMAVPALRVSESNDGPNQSKGTKVKIRNEEDSTEIVDERRYVDGGSAAKPTSLERPSRWIEGFGFRAAWQICPPAYLGERVKGETMMKKVEEGRSPRSRFRLHRSPPAGPPVARRGDLQSLLDEVAKESHLREKDLNSEHGPDLERFVSSTQTEHDLSTLAMPVDRTWEAAKHDEGITCAYERLVLGSVGAVSRLKAADPKAE